MELLLKHCNHYTTGSESRKNKKAETEFQKHLTEILKHLLAALISTIDFKSMDIHEWMVMTTEL